MFLCFPTISHFSFFWISFSNNDQPAVKTEQKAGQVFSRRKTSVHSRVRGPPKLNGSRQSSRNLREDLLPAPDLLTLGQSKASLTVNKSGGSETSQLFPTF